MIRRILIPPVNEHRFITYGDVAAGTRYNQHQFDREWYELLIRDWQTHTYYDQKRQRKDRCSIQISATLNSTCTLKLYKCDKTLVDSYAMSPVLDGQGFAFVWYNDGNPYNAYQFVDNLFWQNEDLTDGRYFFVIEIVNGSDTDKIISEPISLADYHPGTILIEYTNSFNKDLCIFEQTRQKFSVRAEGDVLNFQPLVERVSFLDHEYNTTELSAVPYRGWTVYLGNVPDYILDNQNYAWGLTSKRVEGKSYVAADGAAWTREQAEGSALSNGSLDVRESNIQDAYNIIKGAIVVAELPTYPFVIMPLSVGGDNIYDFYYGDAAYVTNDATRDGYIVALNFSLTQQGMDGEFVLNGSIIEYQLGTNETYTQANTKILTRYVQINSITTGAAQNLNLYLGLIASPEGGSSAYGFVNASGNLVQADYVSGTGLYQILSPHIAGAAGTYSSYLFHDDTLSLLEISGDYIRNFTGSKFPTMLSTFNLKDSPRITEFLIYNTLSDCKSNLKTLSINNNAALINIGNYSYYPFGYVPNNTMAKLNQMYLRYNNQTSANLNALFNSMKDAMLFGEFATHNGTIDTRYQISGGQPTNFPATGNSSQARSMLINNYQWSVFI